MTPTSSAPGALSSFVRRVAATAGRHPKAAIALWLALVIGCVAGGAISGTRTLSDAEDGVGESARAEARVTAAGLQTPAVESILVRGGDADAAGATARELARRLRALPAVAEVRTPDDAAELSTSGGKVVLVRASMRGDPESAEERLAPVQEAVAAARAAHPGTTVSQSGDASFGGAIDEVVESDLRRAELLSLPLTLILLVVAFGALVAASVPLLLGITSVAAAMGALGVVSQVAPNGEATGSLVVLMGLAVGVDYSLFYIRREREERRAGRGPHAAIEAAAATVGRAILVSGVTVVVALAGLFITGLAAFTSLALGSILVVAIAVLGSLTVLPAVLVKLGDRIDRGRIPILGTRGRRPRGAAALAGVVTRRPLAALVTGVCILGALAVPALDLRTGEGSELPRDVPVVRAQTAIERAFPGTPDDVKIVVEGDRLRSAATRERLTALGEHIKRVTGGRGPVEIAVSRDGRTAQLLVPMPDRGIEAAHDTVRRLRASLSPTAASIGPGARVLVGGDAADDLDFSDRLSSRTPIVIALVMALAFGLLLATFRSPGLAATVIACNLLSIGAAYGVMVAVFQHTWAEGLLGFTSSGAIVPWLPLLTFAILFGLSMDYTVLVLERMREARRAGRSPREAAAEGVAATAGVVTSAAIVMVAVFSIFAMLRLLPMKQLGVGMAVAVALDATLVRGVVLPAAVTLLGERGLRLRRWNTAPRTPLAAHGDGDAR